MDTYKLRIKRDVKKQEEDEFRDTLADAEDQEERQKRLSLEFESEEESSGDEDLPRKAKRRVKEEDEDQEDDEDNEDDVSFLRRVDDSDQDVDMEAGANDSEEEYINKKPANGKANGTPKKPQNGTNGTHKSEDGEDEVDRNAPFKEFTPMSKKRRVANTTPPSQISTRTTSTTTTTTPAATPIKTPSKTPSKLVFGTPVSRQQTPSKNSPFFAYKPTAPSIGILDNVNSPATPKPKPNLPTPRKPIPQTPASSKKLSLTEQFEANRNTAAPSISKATYPLDYVLKTQATFTSHTSFDWCSTQGSDDQLLGMASIFSANTTTSTITNSAKYFAATSYFAYPGNTLPFEGDQIGEHHKQFIRTNWIRDRWREWEESFTNLFYTFSAGHTKYFYMIHHSFTALFSRGTVNGPKPSPLRVNIGKSTRVFRIMLHKAGISFSMPYYNGELDYVDQGGDSEAMLELKDMQKTMAWQNSPRTTKALPIVNEQSSALVIEGKSDVEKFYRFMLTFQTKLDEDEERREKERNGGKTPTPKKTLKLLGGKIKPEPEPISTRKMLRDVPALLANTPFLNSAYKRITPRSNDVTTRAATSSAQKLETVFKLELEGPVLPANLQALCELFVVTQKGNFSLALKHDETTTTMNLGMGQGLSNNWVKRAVCGEEGKGTFVLYTENQ